MGIWDILSGSSGYEHRFWPPRGYAVRIEPNLYESDQAHEKATSHLSGLRCLMRRNRVGAYIVMEQDEHRSEYVADTDRRIRFISRFTGSQATVVIGQDWAELATDSRYYLIAERQLGPEWSLRKTGLPGVSSWDAALIERATSEGFNVGVDPRLIDPLIARKLASDLEAKGRKLIPIAENLVDTIWGADRPSLPAQPIVSHPLYLSGEPAHAKVRFLRKRMLEEGAKTFIVYALDEVAWLLNLRGGDIPYLPAFKAFILVTSTTVTLYADKSKLAVDLSHHEGLSIKVLDYDQFFKDISTLSSPVWAPGGGGSWAVSRALKEHRVISEISPVNLRKAVKNCAEIIGAKEAQLKCSISIVKYLAWLGEHIDEGMSEYAGGLKLLEIRQQLPDFMGNSFETISAAGANASMPHYAPTNTDSATITRDAIYLLDSGSQFLQGSTDITRTVHYGTPSSEEIKAYTLVMKGQLAVSSSVFPEGTSGFKLDILARQFLWREGLDYGHGTGHGIGSYLNIHELPLGIGATSGQESILCPGHFVSDEPGYYQDGEFGVRLENDILVVPALEGNSEDGKVDTRKFFTFDVLTLVPYEPKLIDVARLTTQETDLINAYHARCRASLEPYLSEEYEKEWLYRCTKPIN